MTGGRIARLPELADGAVALAGAEAIFWDCAATQRFESPEARAAFHALWFGRYAQHAPAEFFLALDGDGSVEGYLAGAPVSDAPPLPGPDYFTLFPVELIARFPAHLHVNIRADRRGEGIGAKLVSAFVEHCRGRGRPGIHAVTALGSGSAAFFARCGLAPLASARWRGRDLAFLGMALQG